jgi:hypothetical protein
MNQTHTAGVAETPLSTTAPAQGAGRATAELFALTDEQILEIEPEGAESGIVEQSDAISAPASEKNAAADRGAPAAASEQATGAASGDAPPEWLAQLIADPQSGGQAREFWNGVMQARHDAAAFREIFTQPAEARIAAERAQALQQIDQAYFSGTAAQRSELAATMLREDPAAFREMVLEGLRLLQAGEQKATAASQLNANADSRLARAFRSESPNQAASIAAAAANDGSTGVAGHHGRTATEQRVAEYAAFEKSANEDLDRHVGEAISKTLEQALPAAGGVESAGLRSRLSAAVREEVEKALQGDRQLTEQVAKVLGARRLDRETRQQVVRLIGERANQLVPGAARKILSDWTQATIAAHREKSGRGAGPAIRADLPTAVSLPATSDRPARDAATPRSATARNVDYRKLSDEQILAL